MRKGKLPYTAGNWLILFCLIPVLLSVFCSFLMPEMVDADELKKEDLLAGSACLMDGESGRVLFGKQEKTPLPMASTTKIMTCILALEKGNPKAELSVSSRAAAAPKVHLGVKEGQKFLLEDLLYAMMLESDNDAAVIVAEGISGSVEAFAELMNRKAEEIGCKDTHFVTPNGLDGSDSKGEHHTTAVDLARIFRYCLSGSAHSDEFLAITQTKSYSFWDLEKKQFFQCYNHNAFLSMMDGALSGKTGFTAKAGYCYVGALKRDQKFFIVTLLACGWPNHKEYKWRDTRKLMSYGLEQYDYRCLIEQQPVFAPVEVENGCTDGRLGEKKAMIMPVFKERTDDSILMRKEEKPVIEIELPEVLTAPVKKEEEIGTVRVSLNGEELASYPLVASKTVQKKDFLWCTQQITDRFLLSFPLPSL